MLKQQLQKRNQSGFTIIEVMIVLAIAGIIMMLVFLAIPALQRNNRNTQLRSDVSNLLGYTDVYVNNNRGELPPDADNIVNSSGEVEFNGAVVGDIRPGTTADIETVGATVEFPTDASIEKIILVKGAQCDGNDIEAGSNRSVVATYQVETGGDPQNQCQGS